jgi:hypothetical protein
LLAGLNRKNDIAGSSRAGGGLAAKRIAAEFGFE